MLIYNHNHNSSILKEYSNSLLISTLYDLSLEECLITLEYHSIIDFTIFIEIEPGPVSTLPPLISIL